jgi:hypothetical protein
VRLDAGTGYGLIPGADDDGRVADDAAVAAVGNPYESRKLRVFRRLGTEALALRLCDRASAEAAAAPPAAAPPRRAPAGVEAALPITPQLVL